MSSLTAIFDIGKTNKKLLLFDHHGQVIYECNENLPESSDEDGFPCENISLLTEWINHKWKEVIRNKEFNIKAVNFTSYGASFVHLNEYDQVCAPLYNYLKPFPADLQEQFYDQHGERNSFSIFTASPQMGMLNSGMQLYWLKHTKKNIFRKIKTSLHLPQYLSFLFSKNKISEYTSIGCHTNLWDFSEKNYHPWVYKEMINKILPPLVAKPEVAILDVNEKLIAIGCGLHDSSAAIIPYKRQFKDPFLLVSTGTWCIVLNPFDDSCLTQNDLSMDCLNFLSPEGNNVKAARIFLGREHEYQVERISSHFNKGIEYYKQINFEEEFLQLLIDKHLKGGGALRRLSPACMEGSGPFSFGDKMDWDLSQFDSFEEAYFQLMLDLTSMLKLSILLADKNKASTVFVDGGFSRNPLFMNMLANHFPDKIIISSEIAQATALGAALFINNGIDDLNWKLKQFSSSSLSMFFLNYYRSHYASPLVLE